jgi:hypothetical protein
LIKNELKKEIELKGLNTLVNVRKLPDGFHPYIKNLFQYDFGTLEKRKGIKYLKSAYTSKTPFWYLSDDPLEVGTYTIQDDGYGNPVFTKGVVDHKRVPISNVGIKQIINQTYYNPYGNDEIIYIVMGETVPTRTDDFFTVTENTATGEFNADTYQFKLYYKIATGLQLVKTSSVTTSGTGTSINFAWKKAPDGVQFIVIHQLVSGNWVPVYIADAAEISGTLYDNYTSHVLPCSIMPGISDFTKPFAQNTSDPKTTGLHIITMDDSYQGYPSAVPGVPYCGLYIWNNKMPFPSQLYFKNTTADSHHFTYPISLNQMKEMREANGALYIPTSQFIQDVGNTGFDCFNSGVEDNSVHGIMYRYIGFCDKYIQKARGCGVVLQGTANCAPPPANKITIYRDLIILANDTDANYSTYAIPSNKKIYHSEPLAGGTLSCFGETGAVNFFAAGQTTIIESKEDDVSGIQFLDVFTRTGSVTDVSTYLFAGRKNNIYLIEGTWSETSPYISSDFMLHRIGNVGTTDKNALLLTKIGYVFANQQGLFGLSMEGNHSTLSQTIKNVFGDRNTLEYQREGLPQVYNKNNLDPIVRVLLRIDNYDDYCMVYDAWMDLRDSQNVNWFNINSYKLPYLADAIIPKVSSLPIDVFYDETAYETANNLSNPNLFWSINGIPIVFDAGYNDLGNAIDSEFISAEYDFQYPNLLKSFHAIGITVETDDITNIMMQIIEETGEASLQNIYETMAASHALWDSATWDISQWGGKNYEYRKILISPPPVGRTGRLVLIHNELNKNIKIVNLEVFFKMLRRGIML